MIRNHEQRREAHEQRKAKITETQQAKARELQREIGKGNERAQQEIEALEAAERATTRQLKRELVRDAYAALEPLVTRWRAEPLRAITVQLGQQLEQLLQRGRLELGESVSPCALRVLAFCFIDHEVKARPEAVKHFANAEHYDPLVEQIGAVRRAIGNTSALEQALRTLDSALERRARRPVHSGDVEAARERYQVRRRLDDDALAELDAKRDGAALRREIETSPHAGRLDGARMA